MQKYTISDIEKQYDLELNKIIEQIKKCNSAIPLIISFISAILSFFLVGKSNMLLISILISIAGITIFKGRLTNEKSS